MPQGVIKKLVDRGFGSIKGVKGEIFFHQSALESTNFEALSEGQQVEYEEGTGPNGTVDRVLRRTSVDEMHRFS